MNDMLSDKRKSRKVLVKKTKQKMNNFIAMNMKYINGRPKSKKFGLIDT